MPTFLTEPIYPFEFIVGERESIQTDNIVLAAGQNLVPGAILAKTFVGIAAGANAAGNTGNPTIGAITVGAKADEGTYTCVFTDATHYEVFSPSGSYVGSGVLGAAFLAQLRVGFTITAGVTPAIAGDVFNVDVTEGASTYAAATGSDASAILGTATNATTGATPTVAVTRFAEFQTSKANYGAMDALHQAHANAALARKYIIARGGV